MFKCHSRLCECVECFLKTNQEDFVFHCAVCDLFSHINKVIVNNCDFSRAFLITRVSNFSWFELISKQVNSIPSQINWPKKEKTQTKGRVGFKHTQIQSNRFRRFNWRKRMNRQRTIVWAHSISRCVWNHIASYECFPLFVSLTADAFTLS